MRELTVSAGITRREEIGRLAALSLTLPASVAVFLWSLLAGLDLGLWHDEVWSVVRFIDPGPAAVFNGPYVPNNHMLFSLLAWITTSLAADGEIAVRLWSVIPTIGLLAFGTFWTRQRLGWAMAVTFMVLVVANPLVLVVGRQARGYGLAMLCTALMIGAAWEALAPDAPPSRLIPVGVFGALAIFTLPATVLAFLAVTSIVFMRQRVPALVNVGVVGAASVLWYLGNLPELVDNLDQRFGEPLPWHGFLTGSFETLMFPIARLLRSEYIDPFRPPADILSLWTVSALLVLGALAVLGAVRLARAGSVLQSLAVWAPVAFTFTVITASRVWILDRFVIFLIAPMTLLIAAGIVEAARLVTRSSPTRHLAWAIGCLGALGLLYLATPTYERLTTTPIEGFKEVAAIVSRHDGPVLTNSVAYFGLDYYLKGDFEILANDELEAVTCDDPGRNRIVINHPERQQEALDTACLAEAGYEVTRVDQLIRGDWIDVWIPEND